MRPLGGYVLLKFSAAPLPYSINAEFLLAQSVTDKEGDDTCLVLYPRMKLLAVKIQEVLKKEEAIESFKREP